MARAKLSAARLRNPKPGKYGDGGGLWLYVKRNRRAYWIFRYRLKGQDHEMGLGPLADVEAADARRLARRYRNLKREGRDPMTERSRKRGVKPVTFRECAEGLLEKKRAERGNAKHTQQWENTLATYAYPILGDMPVDAIDTDAVKRALEPIWMSKTETASRVRGRIEAVLARAKASGKRQGENPARWKENLEHLLAAPTKIKQVKHYPALPYTEMPAFMAELYAREGIAARALTLLILTALRTEAVIGARYDEFSEGAWAVPGARMKGGRPFRVPLSRQAIALVNNLPRSDGSPFLFPGQRPKKPIADISSVLKRMGRTDIVVHGFRSTFRTWADEETPFPHDLKEAAMAHAIHNKAEEAYRRGELFERRRALMQAWADYCMPSTSENVVPIGVRQTVAASASP